MSVNVLDVFPHCASPIERAMAHILSDINTHETFSDYIEFCGDESDPCGCDSSHFSVTLSAQPKIYKYRPDFMFAVFCNNTCGKLLIECDGRDFHSSLAACKKDFERDQYFAYQGIKTLRFPGKKIINNANECKADISAALSQLLEEVRDINYATAL